MWSKGCGTVRVALFLLSRTVLCPVPFATHSQPWWPEKGSQCGLTPTLGELPSHNLS